MSSTPSIHFDIVYSPVDMTEHTVLPRSSDFSERHDFWNNLFKFDSPECPDSLLLVWPIFGPLSGISVIHSTAAAGKAFENRQPFVAENPDGSKTFHPVASLPATYPLVSRITTFSGILYMTKEPKLSIDAREKPYATLGEAVCAIHEWLLSLQEEVLVGQTAVYNDDVWGCQDPILPKDTKFGSLLSGGWMLSVRASVSPMETCRGIPSRAADARRRRSGRSAWRWRERGERSCELKVTAVMFLE